MNSKIIEDIHWECHSKVTRQQCVDNDYLEYFAAAVIRECLKCCTKVEEDTSLTNYSGGYLDGALLCREEIKEHFGVEK